MIARRVLSALLAQVAVMLVVLLAVASPAPAQDSGAASGEGRIHLGPLGVTPSISVSNIGIDTNVFNEAVDPKRDWTATLAPSVDLWLKLGPSRLTGTTGGRYLYYAKYATQRVWTTGDSARWELPLGRLKPFVLGDYFNSRDRVNAEIDARMHQTASMFGGGTEVAVLSRTTLVVQGTRSSSRFDESATFQGVALANALNHTTDAARLGFRYRLTPFTTFVMDAISSRDRFALDTLRDSNSLAVTAGFQLQPAALISGTGEVGIRRLHALDPVVPDSNSLTAAAGLTYKVAATSATVTVRRELGYSYDAAQPYYNQTNVGLSITQRVTGSWDVTARGTRGWLDYSQVLSSPAATDRVDHVSEYGVGLGYRLGRSLRVGVDAVRSERRSAVVPSYYSTRVGGSFSYVMAQ